MSRLVFGPACPSLPHGSPVRRDALSGMVRSRPEPRLTPESFAARFRSVARALWTLAAGVLGDPSEAEDVLQEAFVQALGKLEDFQPGTDFLAWTGKFVRNVALNERRKRARRKTDPADPEWLDGDEVRPEGGAGSPAAHPAIDELGGLRPDQGAFDDHLVAGLTELSETARACLLLKVVGELGYAEISRALSIPEGTAMSHVHRARVFLRAHLEPRAGEDRPAPSRVTETEVRP
jgi:RNA polymerase sigma-70 factor (ECF subfamily)